MTKVFSMVSAVAIAAAAALSLAAFAGEERSHPERQLACAAALCGLVIF